MTIQTGMDGSTDHWRSGSRLSGVEGKNFRCVVSHVTHMNARCYVNKADIRVRGMAEEMISDVEGSISRFAISDVIHINAMRHAMHMNSICYVTNMNEATRECERAEDMD